MLNPYDFCRRSSMRYAGFTCLILLCTHLCTGANRAYAAFPEKPITMLVGFPAGGVTDLLARMVAEGLERELEVQVAVVNKAGAGGALAYNEVHRAAADGYTIAWVTGSLFTATNIGHLDWTYNELQPVARIAQWPLVVGVRSDAPWQSWGDFLADAKKHPSTFKFGHAGTGSIGHLMNVAVSTGVEVVFVPIGADKRFPALLGGQIDLLSAPAAGFVEFSKAQKMRALLVSSAKRVPSFPNVPTAKEAGIDFQVDLMYAVFAPRGTPERITEKLRGALKRLTTNYEPLLKFASAKEMNIEYLDGNELNDWLYGQNKKISGIMEEVGLLHPKSKED